MEINKIASDFSYLGSRIVEMTIKNDLVSLENDAIKEFGFDYTIINIETTEKERRGFIHMKVSAFVSFGQTEKSEITFIIEGAFAAPLGLEEDTFIKLLGINGATALYSIARAKMETISANVFLNGKITLPMVNILKFIEIKRAEHEASKKEE